MRDDDRNTNTGTSELKAVASEALLIGKRYAQGARQWINQRRSEMANRDQDQQQRDDDQVKRQRTQQSSWQEDYSQQARRSGQDQDDDRQRYRYGSEDRDRDPGSRHGGGAQQAQSRGPQWGGAGGEQAERYGDRDFDDQRGSQSAGRYASQPSGWGGGSDQGEGGRNPQERQYPRGGGYDELERQGGQGQWRGAQGRGQGGQSARGRGDSDEHEQFGQWGTQASDQMPDGRYAGQANAQRGGQGQGREWRSEYNNQPEARQGDLRGRGAAGDQSSHGQGYARGAREQGGQWDQGGQEQWSGASQGSHRGRGPKGYSRSDERIAEDLCEKLADDDQVDASEISIEVRQGVAILTGSVEQRWMKHRVEDLAERCSGVKDVDNQVRVQRSQGSERAGSQANESDRASGASGGASAGSGSSAQQGQRSGEGSTASDQAATASSTPGNGSEGGRRAGAKGSGESSTGRQDS